MTSRKRLGNILKLQVAAFIVLFGASTAHAIGTASTTPINNIATITYEVAGTPQTEVESSPTGNSVAGNGNGTNTQFLVDTVIDFTVSESSSGYTQVTPGASAMALEFTVTNDGNSVQDFSLSAFELTSGTADPFTGTDAFNGAGGGIFVESGATLGYQVGEDVATYIDELDGNDVGNTSVTVYVVRNIGAGVTDAQTSGVMLIAQVATGSDPGNPGTDILTDDSGAGDLPGTVQIVFGEGTGDHAGDTDYNGQHSDTDAYIVRTVTLEITKTSSVVWDPISLAVNPKAIPGARVEYTITVDNTAGTGTATNVAVTDDLSVEIGNGTIDFYVDGYGSGTGIEVTTANLYGGAATALTNGSGDDEGTWDAGSGTITVDTIEVAPGATSTVKYQVTIQ